MKTPINFNKLIADAIINDTRLAFKAKSGSPYLSGGICPDCGKKELFVSLDKPGVIKCNRLNKCGYEEHTRERYSHLFNNMAKTYPATVQNPTATADAYLQLNRGFKINSMAGWYSQELYTIKDNGGNIVKTVPTIRFYIDANKERYWERLIDVTKNDLVKQRNNISGRRKKFDRNDPLYDDYNNTLYKGEAWQPPGQEIKPLDHVYIVEGIFHALALHLCGIKAVATLSANNYPTLTIAPLLNKKINWVLGYDDDPAGRSFMLKGRKKLLANNETVGIALTGSSLDWDDLYRHGKLTEDFFNECRYRGRLFTAKNIGEKAWHWYKFERNQPYFKFYTILDFNGSLYAIDVQNEITKELEHSEDNSADIDATGEQELFARNVKIANISNVFPSFLYCQVAMFTGDISYDFNVVFSNGANDTQISVPGSSLESSSAFNKALLAKAPGAIFTGKQNDFNFLIKKWFAKKVKRVETISFIGYSTEHKSYIFPGWSYNSGKRIDINQHGFFDINDRSVKTSSKSIPLIDSNAFDDSWLPNYSKVFDKNGMVVLSYWLGSLFAEQIRQKYKSFPFLELCGEPGTGKSTVLEFLWRCVGREDYEGYDPSKSTFAGRSRALMQVANLPVVLIEGDRTDDNGKRVGFDYDELKTAFNGRAIRTMGVMNRGAETEEPPFRASIIFAQNQQINASAAMMERIVSLTFTQEHFTEQTAELNGHIERLTTEQLSGFLHAVLSIELKFLEKFDAAFDVAKKRLNSNSKLRNPRLILNHAQLMAAAACIPLVFKSVDNQLIADTFNHIEAQAELRHQTLALDHPIVAKFWEIYEFLNEKVDLNGSSQQCDMLPKNRINHSNKEGVIAINLPHFHQVCSESRVEVLKTDDLKVLLPRGKRYQLIEANKPIKSSILKKSVRCMIFNKK